ncbi:hypothetical protein NSP30_23770, partial [Salmonella enterica]|nr:hypothetical protein [Salmonella enterica]
LHPAQRLGGRLQLFGAELFHVTTPGLGFAGLSPERPAVASGARACLNAGLGPPQRAPRGGRSASSSVALKRSPGA